MASNDNERTVIKKGPRRILKPLMEKRRRARINESLQQLRSLVEADSRAQGSPPRPRLEKADILDMTVSYLKSKQNGTKANANQYGPRQYLTGVTTPNTFFDGYRACLSEVSRYLDNQNGITDDFRGAMTDFISERSRDKPPEDMYSTEVTSERKTISTNTSSKESTKNTADVLRESSSDTSNLNIQELYRNASNEEPNAKCNTDVATKASRAPDERGSCKCQPCFNIDPGKAQSADVSTGSVKYAVFVPTEKVAVVIPQTFLVNKPLAWPPYVISQHAPSLGTEQTSLSPDSNPSAAIDTPSYHSCRPVQLSNGTERHVCPPIGHVTPVRHEASNKMTLQTDSTNKLCLATASKTPSDKNASLETSNQPCGSNWRPWVP